jgi:predicted dehydrogenase
MRAATDRRVRMTRVPITIAILGAGHMGRRHAAAARQLAAAGRCRVVGVADTCGERAGSLAAELGVQAFEDCGALLRGAAPDLVVVATPPVQHVQDVIACLERGTHVLCEKPYAVSGAGCAAIAAAHRDAGSVLAPMASKYRYDRAVRRARSLVDDGAIGTLLSLRICFAQDVDMSSRWNARPEISGGGVLMDNGPHAFDLAHLFLGPLASVSAKPGEDAVALAVEASVHVSGVAARGGTFEAYLAWNDASHAPYFLELAGSTGTLKVGWKDSCLARDGAENPLLVGEGFDGPGAIRAQLEDVLRSIESRTPPQATFDDAMANVMAIAAAYRAMGTPPAPAASRSQAAYVG